MDVFSDVYGKSVDLLKTKCFDDRWSNIEPKLKALLAAGGPNDAEAPVLDLIRQSLNVVARKENGSDAVAQEILEISRYKSAGFEERAALLKTIRHFYFVNRAGNQSVWVCDGPKAYHKWAYDLFPGKAVGHIKGSLQHDHEAFGGGNRKMFSDALQLTRKWSADIVAKLGKPDDDAVTAARRWFHRADASDDDVKKTAAVLLDGFKKISATCNSTHVIFSDRPHKRADPGFRDTVASVNAGDAMPVIYIFKLFLDAGKRNRRGHIGKLWYCALTIVHELSHKLAGTDDIQYDTSGLKPNATFTPAQSLKNADSWGYFAADLVGALSRDTLDTVYQ
jgi:hypothetical protein